MQRKGPASKSSTTKRSGGWRQKERRAAGAPRMEDDEPEVVGMHPEPHAVPTQWDDAHPTD